ncbi:hypothetical protein HK100_008770 [Physocladia obscura]|uniref:BZIP domain-containing protein n=1 Tax=Physocladia obscura TaxID=109957 RepID=A0AAD5XEH6_9FUNG|nr:hypothetical protein HK100_008770 [Physocladia obscura]
MKRGRPKLNLLPQAAAEHHARQNRKHQTDFRRRKDARIAELEARVTELAALWVLSNSSSNPGSTYSSTSASSLLLPNILHERVSQLEDAIHCRLLENKELRQSFSMQTACFVSMRELDLTSPLQFSSALPTSLSSGLESLNFVNFQIMQQIIAPNPRPLPNPLLFVNMPLAQKLSMLRIELGAFSYLNEYVGILIEELVTVHLGNYSQNELLFDFLSRKYLLLDRCRNDDQKKVLHILDGLRIEYEYVPAERDIGLDFNARIDARMEREPFVYFSNALKLLQSVKRNNAKHLVNKMHILYAVAATSVNETLKQNAVAQNLRVKHDILNICSQEDRICAVDIIEYSRKLDSIRYNYLNVSFSTPAPIKNISHQAVKLICDGSLMEDFNKLRAQLNSVPSLTAYSNDFIEQLCKLSIEPTICVDLQTLATRLEEFIKLKFTIFSKCKNSDEDLKKVIRIIDDSRVEEKFFYAIDWPNFNIPISHEKVNDSSYASLLTGIKSLTHHDTDFLVKQLFAWYLEFNPSSVDVVNQMILAQLYWAKRQILNLCSRQDRYKVLELLESQREFAVRH